jgi:hypothetical protein
MTQTAAIYPQPPRPSVRQMQARLATELSLGSRILFTLLLLFALAVATVVGSLWLTEPALPARTRVAFGVIVVAALAWAAAFAWTLARRKVLLARHRLVTSRLAVLWSTVFTAGAAALAVSAPELRQSALAAAAFGTLLLAVAVVLWRRATTRYHRLTERVRRLEQEMS